MLVLLLFFFLTSTSKVLLLDLVSQEKYLGFNPGCALKEKRNQFVPRPKNLASREQLNKNPYPVYMRTTCKPFHLLE